MSARVEDSSVARVAAAEAERSYALLASELPRPRGTIELTLFDNVDFSNGFTTVSPTNRIAIYLATAATTDELGEYDSWLRVVITHELTHVFHLDDVGGVWKGLQWVFGRDPLLFPNAYQPSWVVEGLAVYYESRFSNGGREAGGFHTQLLRAADAAGDWPPPNDVVFSSIRWPSGIGRYAYGSRFFALEAAEYGDSVVPRFVRHTSGQLWPSRVSGPLTAAGGDNVPHGWHLLQQRYAAPSGAADSVLLTGMRGQLQLVRSPDGTRLALVRNDGRTTPRVEIRDLDGRVLARHLVNGGVDLAWLGDTLLVTQLDFDSPVTLFSDLYRWTPDGRWTRVTHGARVAAPFAWGGAAGVVQVAGDARQPVEWSGGAWTPLATPPADEWGKLARAPDDAWVAGTRLWHGRWDLVVWPVDNPAAARPVTDDQAVDADPTWSSDGAWVLFASERSGVPQIYAYRLADATLVRVTDNPTGAREPALVPGGRLFYSTMGADGYAMAVRDSALARAAPADTAPTPPPFTPAPPVAAREGAYHPWWGLVPRFWLPLADPVGGGSGSFWGGVTYAADALGRADYTLGAFYGPRLRRAEGYLFTDFTHWRHLGLDAYVEQTWQTAGDFYAPDSSLATVSERDRTASAGVTWRWRRWRSALSVRVGGEVTQAALVQDVVPLPFVPVNPWYGGGIVSVGASRVTQPSLSMSLENGFVLSAFYRRRHELNGARTADEARGALSTYVGLPIGGWAHWVLAARVAAQWSGGSNPFLAGIGGSTSDVYSVVPGLTLGGGRRTFPLRGYDASGDRYTRVTIGQAELRIPLLLVGRSLGRLPVGLDRVGVTLFGETGGGWTAATPAAPTAYSDVGAEAVLDLLGLLGGRLRIGAAMDLTDGLGHARGDVRPYLALGSSF